MSDDTEEQPLDIGDGAAVRENRRDRELSDHEEGIAVTTLMSSSAGRRFIYDLLDACHIYSTSYSDNASRMAFQEGERNIGLRLVAVIQRACPQRYNEMLIEANERLSKQPTRKSAPARRTEFDPAKPFGGFFDADT
jgi:hypothetical protein